MENQAGIETKIKKAAREHFLGMELSNNEAEELIEDGIAAIKSKIHFINLFIKKKDIEGLIRAIHSIKGVLLNLGMEKEAEIFNNLKRKIGNKNIMDEDIIREAEKAVKELTK